MRIMVCYDDSDESSQVLWEAIKHAKAFNAEVMLVMSATDNNRYNAEVVEFFAGILKEGQVLFDKNNIVCTTHISYRKADMSVGEDLVNFARKEQVDVIFLGIRARSRIGKFLIGSVAQYVILNADCPVIGVKKNKSEPDRKKGVLKDAA